MGLRHSRQVAWAVGSVPGLTGSHPVGCEHEPAAGDLGAGGSAGGVPTTAECGTTSAPTMHRRGLARRNLFPGMVGVGSVTEPVDGLASAQLERDHNNDQSGCLTSTFHLLGSTAVPLKSSPQTCFQPAAPQKLGATASAALATTTAPTTTTDLRIIL